MRASYFAIVATAAIVSLSAASALQADVIASTPEDFDSTTAGQVPTGWQVGYNAGGGAADGETVAGGGVGGTNGFKGTSALNINSTSSVDLTTGATYDFSVAFQYLGDTTASGFVGVGFADATGIALNDYNANLVNRMIVGLAYDGAGDVALASAGEFNDMNAANLSFAGTTNGTGEGFALTTSEWYLFSGSISLTTGATPAWNFTNMSLQDIGASGISAPGSNLLPTTSFTENIPYGAGLDGNKMTFTAAYFSVYGWGESATEGVNTIDNIDETPEPASLSLLAMGSLLMLRRRSCRH